MSDHTKTMDGEIAKAQVVTLHGDDEMTTKPSMQKAYDLKMLNTEEFLKHHFPKHEPLIGPINRASINMVSACTGIGKTLLSVAIASAGATATDFLNWTCDRPLKVLYLDGEMNGEVMQQRVRAEMESRGTVKGELVIVSVLDYLLPNGAPAINLANPEWLKVICHWAPEFDLIICDNLMSLASVPGVSMASDEWWAPIYNNLRILKSRGYALLLSHHDNKGGEQFGTVTKEWQMDLFIKLDRDGDYNPVEGAKFQMKFSKTRQLDRELMAPSDVQLSVDEHGRQLWTCSKAAMYSRVADTYNNGLTDPKKIAELLGLARTTVYDHINRAKKKGLIASKNG